MGVTWAINAVSETREFIGILGKGRLPWCDVLGDTGGAFWVDFHLGNRGLGNVDVVKGARGGNRREFPPSIGFLSHSETMVSLRDGNGGIRETEVDQFVSPLQQAVQSRRKLRRRKRLIAGGDVKDAVQSLSLMIQNMQNPLIREAEESLLLMEGKVFNSIEEMKSFVSSLSAMLKPLEMRIRCPSGKYAGAPARLSVTLSGRSREPRFCYLVQVDGAIKSVTDHANGMRVPKLSLCRAPLDGRRKNFE